MVVRALACSLLIGAVLAGPLSADVVEVTVTGVVEFNQINPPPLGNVSGGDAATLTFRVASDDFVDNQIFPTRGYVIDQSSYSLTLGGEVMSLQNPFPAGQTPYFVLRDNDPAVDGFYTSTDLNGPLGLPINQTGQFGQFRDSFRVTYTGGTLSSLDILDALGTYDFTDLTVFGWSIDDGPFKGMFIVYEQMTISAVGECFMVVGPGTGAGVFSSGAHVWDTQVGEVEDHYAVLMEDLPEFVLPGVARGDRGVVASGAAVGLPGSSAALPSEMPDWMADGSFSVQIVMWNPGVFPATPEQQTYGLHVSVLPNGQVHTHPFGNGTGMEVWAETFVNADGQRMLRFPFSIPGLD